MFSSLPFTTPNHSGKMNTHEEAQANEAKNQRLKEAFAIRKDYSSGQAFDRELQAERREQRKLVCWLQSLLANRHLYCTHSLIFNLPQKKLFC